MLRLLLLLLLLAGPARAQPVTRVDLADLSTAGDGLLRALGSTGDGSSGVPVAGGFDCDGDGHRDAAFAAMTSSPLSRAGAGQIFLVFGDGTISGTHPTAGQNANVAKIIGAHESEAAGSELWMDDVTGDGLGDLLIARQNHDPGGSVGAGALTILVGGSELKDFAGSVERVDLADAPAAIPLTVATFVGRSGSRLGIWMRTGDVTGDGVADIVVGADQNTAMGQAHRGTAYVIRGGSHLAADQVVDLGDFGTPAFAATGLDGHVAKLDPPALPAPGHFHFGATCQIGDLDGDGRAEVLVAAALNRAGAAIAPSGGIAHGTGGSTDGTLYIVWGDNFTANPWASGYQFDVDLAPGSYSIIDGGDDNKEFGEEILAGLDYDADGHADLFVGDITGDLTGGSRLNAGAGHVFYEAAELRGLVFDLDDIGTLSPPPVTTTFLGAAAGHIAADTAAHGDFDGDGIADLAFSSPHASPFGRSIAGTIHLFHGQHSPWPAWIDLAAPPPPTTLRLTEVYGANGSSGSDAGDTLCYSAAAGDMDGDGRIDLITNEMLGNGLVEDEGNLIILSGKLLPGVATVVPAQPPWLGGAAAAVVVLAAALRALLRARSQTGSSSIP